MTMTTSLDGFDVIRKFIANSGVNSSTICDDNIFAPCQRRLLRAFHAGLPSRADIAPLIRHVLRHASETQGGFRQTLRVPHDSRWPSIKEWDQHGVDATTHSSGQLVLRARPWRPDWLYYPDEGKYPTADVFREAPRRDLERCEGDFFIKELLGNAGPLSELATYLTGGQKQAVRSVLSAPPASTLVVNLPTGTGKSLCAHIMSKMPPFEGGIARVTVVVEPTVALALDQERAIEKYIGYPTAYRGGMDEATRLRNREIRNRVKNGEQAIVFTSPESLTGSLKDAVYAAAKQGYLRALVVDEAHIVDQWGDEFRPSFQEIAGLRRALLRICPTQGFRTVMLSATLTESSVATLKALFGDPGPFRIISAVQLRPEPVYWISKCDDIDQQLTRVLEALRNLPRPLILYTTRRDGAERWYNTLRNKGHRRLSMMTGDTPSAKRDQIIRRWAESELDVMVATSAFGLGIDKSDVRCIVHACVPETLDRFYQEVGRGGRDGNASFSLLVWTEDDLETAKGINRKTKTFIGVERGLERWKRMFDTKVELDATRWRVRIDSPPGFSPRDIDMSSKLSIGWNARTLTLMSRAGLIALDDEPPPSFTIGVEVDSSDLESDLQDNDYTSRKANLRVVKILDQEHLSLERWKARVDPIRDELAKTQRHQMGLMREVLRGKRCVAEILSEAYSFTAPLVESGRRGTPVASSCGGCSYCRQQKREPFSHSPSSPPWPWTPRTEVEDRLQKYLAGYQVLALFYPSLDSKRELLRRWQKLLLWMIRQGIQSVVASEEVLRHLSVKMDELSLMPVFVSSQYRPTTTPMVPTILFLSVGERFSSRDAWMRRIHTPHMEREPLVLVLPDNMVDPDRPDRSLRSVLPCPRLTMLELEIEEGL